jgi:hypothetical protein
MAVLRISPDWFPNGRWGITCGEVSVVGSFGCVEEKLTPASGVMT